VTVVGEAIVQVKPDATGFGSELSRDVNGRLRDARGRFVKAGNEIGGGLAQGASSGFQKESGGIVKSAGSLAKRAAIAFGAAFVLDKGIDLFRGAFVAGDEARRVAAQTEAVIRSTGQAANVTADDIDHLASTISAKTGIDDEAIQSGSNLLLTFKNIRNEAGAGNDIFNQATSILTDMSKALGTEVSGSAVQLGKALNDPLKGIQALSRVGVTFSDQQKEQIRNFVEAGDVASAQKVILQELASEFGGSAEAQASALDRLKVLYGNLQETLGQALDPAVQQLAPILAGVVSELGPMVGVIGGLVGQVLTAFAPLLSELAPILRTVGSLLTGVIGTALRALVPIISSAIKFLTPLVQLIGRGLSQGLKAVGPVLATVGEQIGRVFDVLGPVLQDVFEQVLRDLGPQLPQLAQAFSEIAISVGDLVVALVPILIPLTKLAALIATKIQAPILLLLAKSVSILAAALTVLVRPIAALLGSGLSTLIGWLEDFVGLFTKANLAQAGQQFVAGLQMIGDGIMAFVGLLGDAVADVAQFFVDLPGRVLAGLQALPGLLVSFWTTALSTVANLVSTGLSNLLAFWISLPFRILNAVATLLPQLLGFLARLFPQLIAAEVRGLGLMVSFFVSLPGRILGAVSSLLPRLVSFMGQALGAAASAAGRGVSSIVGEIAKLPGRILGLGQRILDAGSTIGGKIISGIKAGVSGAAGVVGDLASAIGRKLTDMLRSLIQKINDAIPDKLGKGPLSIGLPHNPIPNPFAFGGVTTEGRIDGTRSTRPEVVVPLSRGARLAAQVARESGLLDMIGLGSGSPLFGMEVPISVSFVGVVPTQQEAVAVGRAIGDGVADRALARRRVLADARTARGAA
jgi:phage-related protein